MQKIERHCISLALILLLIAGCSFLPSPNERAELLQQNISKYQNFQLSGIAEINYKNFRIRQNLLVSNSPQKFSAVLVEGGVFGMKAAPLASLQIGTKTELKFMGREEKLPFKAADFREIFSPDLLKKHSSVICSELKLSLNELDLFWNESMQIEQIRGEQFRVDLGYDYQQELANIKFWYKTELVLDITVDEITFN
jgi:hypothetical protein